MIGALDETGGTPEKSQVGANELAREVKRVFPKLASAGNYLAALGKREEKPEEWGLFTARSHFQKPVAIVSARIVEAMYARDLIAIKNTNLYELSKAGSAFYRRLVATDDPYQNQHQQRREQVVTTAVGVTQKVIVNDNESPLAWLRRRKGADGKPFLSQEQFEAGERLRADFTYAQLEASTTSNWNSSLTGNVRRRTGEPGGAAVMRDNVIAAKKRFHSALEDVGSELSSVLVHVCCHLKGLEDMEKAMVWPKRSGKVVLRIALQNLARYYGMVQRAQPNSSRRPPSQYWGASGYKPNIDG